MIKKLKIFIGEVRAELGKATWPWDPKEKGLKKYRELIDSTGIVLIAMLLLGAFVAVNDFFLINAVSYFTRTELQDRAVMPEALDKKTAPLAPSAETSSQQAATPSAAEATAPAPLPGPEFTAPENAPQANPSPSPAAAP